MLQLIRLVSLRHLFGAPLRSFLTIVGVAVGVATMVGVTAINRSVMKAFRSTIDGVAGKADLSVASPAGNFDDSLIAKVKETPGVLHASGGVNVVAPVSGKPGESLYVMGVDLLDDGYFRTYEGVDKDVRSVAEDLEFLNSTDRLLLSERFAAAHGLSTGDSITLQTAEGETPFIVHGLIKESGAIKAFGGSVAVMDIASAQAAFGKGRNIDRIDVGVDPKVGVEAVQARLKAALGPTFEVERPSRRGGSVEKMVLSFQMGLNLGSGVALLVGVFLVYNTVAIGVVQRRREIGILRALGTTRRRIRALFTLEAVVMGLFGTALGLPLGGFVARSAIHIVSDAISSIYIQVKATDVQVALLEASMGVALGLFGSAFAALRPAVVASRVQPVEAFRRDVAAGADIRGVSPLATSLGVLFALAAYPMTFVPSPVENFPIGGYLAIFCVMMTATLLSPLLLKALRNLYQWPGQLFLGISGRLAADNFSRAPVRTAVPVSALALGVAMAVGLSGFITSFETASQKWISQSVPADLFITSSSKMSGVQNVPMRPELADEFRNLPGVQHVDLVRIHPQDAFGLRIYVISLTQEIFYQHGNPTFLEGKPPTGANREPGALVISENLSRRRNLHLGDPFELATPSGPRQFKVGGVIIDYTSDQGAVFIDRAEYKELWKDDAVDTIELYFSDLSKVEEVRKTITEKFGKKYDLYVLTNAELRVEAQNLIRGAFSISYAMEAVAIILALLGVINTLLAAVLDRTREIGLLRAIGAAKSHVMRLFTGEAAFIGLTGGVLGVVTGQVMGLIIVKVVGGEATGWTFPYASPWETITQMLVASTVCSLLAGLYPARRAASLDVVEALAYE